VFSSTNIDNVNRLRRMEMAGCVAGAEKKRMVQIFTQKFRGNRYFVRTRSRRNEFLKFAFKNLL
jgi:hypothetical protein